jgi:hypothetical protein
MLTVFAEVLRHFCSMLSVNELFDFDDRAGTRSGGYRSSRLDSKDETQCHDAQGNHGTGRLVDLEMIYEQPSHTSPGHFAGRLRFGRFEPSGFRDDN